MLGMNGRSRELQKGGDAGIAVHRREEIRLLKEKGRNWMKKGKNLGSNL